MPQPKPPDDLVATMIDPQGRTVWLAQAQLDHIIEEHPEVGNHVDWLKKSVEKAEKRTKGNYKDSEKLWASRLGPSKWLCVVVRYEGRIGTVRTALASSKGPRPGDEI